MSSPLWSYPGVWEGRLAPTQSAYFAYDSGELYYYGEWWVDEWYYYYEGEEGIGQGHVFCLGSDQEEHPWYRVQVGDYISVQQTFTIDDAQKLLRFGWRMRTPDDLPEKKTIIQGGAVNFKTNSLMVSGDGLQGIIVPSPALPFSQDDAEQLITVSGSTRAANNGTFRSSGVPFNQAGVDGGDRIILENDAIEAIDDPAVTVVREGLQWVARAYVDEGAGFVERVKLIEEPGHTSYRNELALHLSKWTGELTVKFEMALETVP